MPRRGPAAEHGAQSLDYATPPPRPPSAPLTRLRFVAGAGLGLFAFLAIGLWTAPPAADDDPVCPAIGVSIEVAIVALLFHVGRGWRCRRSAPGWVERNRAATFAGGVAVAALLPAFLFVFQHATSMSEQGAAGLAFLLLFSLSAASPWWVYRATRESDPVEGSRPD